jgi:hypothetical protein
MSGGRLGACDHLTGYAFYCSSDGVGSVYMSQHIRLKRIEYDLKFKFCPLCGVEIEGDLG